jgi:predicted dehydrogenase/threonine dehydrogenase-like Zn-dependent dehydrogenase
MKQVLQNLRDGETKVVDVPIPAVKPGMALVRTSASLVSAGTERMLVEFAGKSLVGKARSRPDLARQVVDKARREGLLTTLEAAFNRLDQPMPLGYSSAGEILRIGEGLDDLKVGQRVVCAGGGYAVHAEYVLVPRNLLAELPDHVDYESAAFSTLGAIALHGFRLSQSQLGERVAVIGLGLLGLLMVGIANAAGCQVLGVDLDPYRVDLAKAMDAEAVLRDEAEEMALSFSQGRGCDTVLICADTTSSDPVELAGIIARDRAHVVATGAVGLEIPRKIYYEKELSFVNSRSYGPGRYDSTYEEKGKDYPIGYVRWTEGRNLEAFVDLLATNRLDVKSLITHRFPISQATQAYELITGKTGEPFLGVLLTYPDEPNELDIYESPVVEVISPEEPEELLPVSCKLGVLGAGNFANAVLLPAVKRVQDVDLVAIASGAGLNAQHAAKKFGFQYVAKDEIEILDDPSINTVAILTRHHLHAAQVIDALEAGKNVFCEKPLAINKQELTKISEVFKETMGKSGNDEASPTSPQLMVGFNRRFAPLARKLFDFTSKRQEPLVAYYRVNAGFLPLDHWLHDPEQGGGRIIGEACHFVDFLTFLIGSPPTSVQAQSLPDLGRYHQDNAVMTFAFPDGSLGTVSYLANGDKTFPKEWVEVFVGGRIAILDDFRSLELIDHGKRHVERSRLRQDKGHQAEWEAFSSALKSGGPPPIPYKHIFGVTTATFAAMKALQNGERVDISI